MLGPLALKAHATASHYRNKYNEAQAALAARDGGVRPVGTNPYEDGK